MLKFGDAVVLVQKSRDGEISRVNAIVLHSVVQPDGAEEFSPKEAEVQRALKAANGKPLPGGEYVDLAFPNLGLTPQGQPLTTRSVELIFKLAYTVAPWNEGAWLGWEPAVAPAEEVADPTESEKKAAEATSTKVRQIKGK
jgi:hypothetical protein